jgi:hypothetical protein
LPKVIDGKNTDIKNIASDNPYINRNVEQRAINALRLFKKGIIYSLGALESKKNIFSLGISYYNRVSSKPFIINNFQLIEKEKREFFVFWNLYKNINISEKHFLSVAIRRFSQAHERESIEDKIIDFLISAEALFLSSSDGNIQGELKYRLSHRAAMFIEDETEKQRKIFKFMQKAYDVRSAIIHGATPKFPKKEDGTAYTLDEFCNEVEEYLRYSLKKAINLASTTANISKFLEWDSIIFPTVK